MTEDIADLLERTFDALNRSDGNTIRSIELLRESRPRARVYATIRAFLLADESIRATFSRPSDQPSEADPARRAALTLAELADAAERDGERAGPLTLIDLDI